jgi:hypothetical protein
MMTQTKGKSMVDNFVSGFIAGCLWAIVAIAITFLASIGG